MIGSAIHFLFTLGMRMRTRIEYELGFTVCTRTFMLQLSARVRIYLRILDNIRLLDY